MGTIAAASWTVTTMHEGCEPCQAEAAQARTMAAVTGSVELTHGTDRRNADGELEVLHEATVRRMQATTTDAAAQAAADRTPLEVTAEVTAVIPARGRLEADRVYALLGDGAQVLAELPPRMRRPRVGQLVSFTSPRIQDGGPDALGVRFRADRPRGWKMH